MINDIIFIRTDYCYEIKTLVDILEGIVEEIKLEFIRDPNQDALMKKKNKKNAKSEKSKDSDSEDSENSDSDDNAKKNKKNAKNNKDKKNSKKKHADSDDDSDDNDKKSSDTDKKKKNMGGIRIIELDEHQTLLVYVKLNSDKFDEFYMKYPSYSAALNLIPLQKFMKTIDKESVMTIRISQEDEQNIIFEVDNNVKDSSIQYSQKLLDLDDAKKKVPKHTNFDMLVTIDTQEFHKLCRDMSGFSQYVEITCTKKEIKFTCQGDCNAFSKKFTNADEGVRIMGFDKDKNPTMVQAIYELRHLVTFSKCQNLCNELQLFLKNDYPLFIHYTVATLGKMLVGITPVDEKNIKRDKDYDDNNDEHYNPNVKATVKKQL